MKLSSRAVYGIRVCSLIATEEKTPVALPALAEKTDLSEKYLEQILGSLVKGGVLESTRGVNGGYALAHPAEEISLYKILSAVDDAFTVGCVSINCGEGCSRSCPDKSTFAGIEEKINGIFKLSSLAEIVRGREEL